MIFVRELGCRLSATLVTLKVAPVPFSGYTKGQSKEQFFFFGGGGGGEGGLEVLFYYSHCIGIFNSNK